jgi:hypothetical protein
MVVSRKPEWASRERNRNAGPPITGRTPPTPGAAPGEHRRRFVGFTSIYVETHYIINCNLIKTSFNAFFMLLSFIAS